MFNAENQALATLINFKKIEKDINDLNCLTGGFESSLNVIVI